jgi:hypothetical protein
MQTCAKCGGQAAYWTIVDKENNLKEYCDACFKKYDMAGYKKEMDEFQKRRQEDKKKD